MFSEVSDNLVTCESDGTTALGAAKPKWSPPPAPKLLVVVSGAHELTPGGFEVKFDFSVG